MIFEVNQVQSNGANLFDVVLDGNIIFKAETPWLNIAPALRLERLQQLHLQDASGNAVYHTEYDVIENVAESAIPFKYLFTGTQKLAKYKIVDQDGNILGSMFYDLKGIFDEQLCLEYKDRILIAYPKGAGKINVVSFYDGEQQIGQITHPNYVVNNLDRYMLHFVDGYDDLLPVLSFFTIYYDMLTNNHGGEYRKGQFVENNVSYTHNKNDNKYHKDFILNTFGAEEHDKLNEFIKNQKVIAKTDATAVPETDKTNAKFALMIVSCTLGFILLITLIILLLIFL